MRRAGSWRSHHSLAIQGRSLGTSCGGASPLFPGSAWEHTVSEAPPRGGRDRGGATSDSRSKAGALERVGWVHHPCSRAPPGNTRSRRLRLAAGGIVAEPPATRVPRQEPWNELVGCITLVPGLRLGTHGLGGSASRRAGSWRSHQRLAFQGRSLGTSWLGASPLFPGSAWEHTVSEAPPCGGRGRGGATIESRSKAGALERVVWAGALERVVWAGALERVGWAGALERVGLGRDARNELG
ncbi:hypothetical protein Mal15_33950 [Stieleria maiorica]|uniref:Uncharacterized protein n=1 Tax=Stieleria maiorica TaxID=2795974 RepID=A0A5B9MDI2_9BACT|nr:hypothetical protein Mal15_33950 [Stieleria maiorica]